MTTYRRCGWLHAGSLLVVGLALSRGPGLAQPERPACDLVSDADVVHVIGPVQKKQAMGGPDGCAWIGKDRTFSIVRVADQTPEAIEGLLGVPGLRAAEGDAVSDEPGIGDAAVSEVPKAGNRVTLFVASGSTLWNFSVEHVYGSGNVADTLPGVKEAAKKALRPASP
jgi:hypothetical protein